MGFDCETCAVLISIDRQSPDISQGVTEGEGLFKEQGAGDQGLMFGYACNETRELMPMPIIFAHQLTKRLSMVRKNGMLPFLRPDGKSQVSIQYINDKPIRVDSVVVSSQHAPDVTYETLREAIIEEVVKKVIPADLMDEKTKFFINPTGRFVVGGPMGDCGLTGRKIIVDTYGGQGSHGGGAFSGKDPSKVDRSASYMARYVAKNIVAAGLADQVRSAGGLRHRRGRAGLGHDQHLRHRQDLPEPRLPRSPARSSTCGRGRSSRPSTCCARSTNRPPPTATSAANSRSSTWERTDRVDVAAQRAGI